MRIVVSSDLFSEVEKQIEHDTTPSQLIRMSCFYSLTGGAEQTYKCCAMLTFSSFRLQRDAVLSGRTALIQFLTPN